MKLTGPIAGQMAQAEQLLADARAAASEMSPAGDVEADAITLLMLALMCGIADGAEGSPGQLLLGVNLVSETIRQGVGVIAAYRELRKDKTK